MFAYLEPVVVILLQLAVKYGRWHERLIGVSTGKVGNKRQKFENPAFERGFFIP